LGDTFEQFKREIDEELQRDRYEKLWRDYGKYAIAAAVALVLGVAAATAWQQYRHSLREADEVRFSEAKRLVEEGKRPDAAALFASLASAGDSNYGVLAKFHHAAIRAEAGESSEAASEYKSLADDGNLAQPLRDLATLLLGLLRIDASSGDEAQDLAKRLERLADSGGAWRHSANELLGLMAQKAGDATKAKERFRRIVDDAAAPQGARARAAQMLSAMGA
jgi:hypothetical protein